MPDFSNTPLDVARAEMKRWRASYEVAVEHLTRIYSLLNPPDVKANGKTYRFENPHANETLQALSDAIRAIPEELRAVQSEITESAYDTRGEVPILKEGYPDKSQSTPRVVAHPDKDPDLFLCRGDGEGTHEFKVCRGYKGVADFYEQMCGRDQDDTLDSLKSTFEDPEEWRNDGAALKLELYCARFYVWKVSAAELAMPGADQSATTERDAARYRWLRQQADHDTDEDLKREGTQFWRFPEIVRTWYRADVVYSTLDAAVDAAMGADSKAKR